MPILPIVTYNDDILRGKTEPVDELTDDISSLIEDMFETMYNSDGVGLAAPQIGKKCRLFVADVDPMVEQQDKMPPGAVTMINPEIVQESNEKVEMEEGCLSIPGVNAAVVRPKSVIVQYRDENFESREMEADGWLSRVIQHEIDHLEGTLFLDHLSFFKKKLLSSKLREIEEGEKETDYPLVPKKKIKTS